MMANTKGMWFLTDSGNSSNAEIVLADTSIRRLGHLNRIGIKAKYVGSDFEVKKGLEAAISVQTLVKSIAEEKVYDVAAKLLEMKSDYDIIIAFHTVTVLDRKVISKPLNPGEALTILKEFNGREHTIVTGVALLPRDKKLTTFSAKSKVKFGVFSDEMFEAYLKSDEWKYLDIPYNIFEKGAAFIESLDGCFHNVFMGIPAYKLVKRIGKLMNGSNMIESSVEKKEEAVPVQKKDEEHAKKETAVNEKAGSEPVAAVEQKEEDAVVAAQQPKHDHVEEESVNVIQPHGAAVDQEIDHRSEEGAPKNNASVSHHGWEDTNQRSATANRGFRGASSNIPATTLAPTRGSSSGRFVAREDSPAPVHQNGSQRNRGSASNGYNTRGDFSSGPQYQRRDSNNYRGRSAPRGGSYSSSMRYENDGQMNRATSSYRTNYDNGYNMRDHQGNGYNSGSGNPETRQSYIKFAPSTNNEYGNRAAANQNRAFGNTGAATNGSFTGTATVSANPPPSTGQGTENSAPVRRRKFYVEELNPRSLFD